MYIVRGMLWPRAGPHARAYTMHATTMHQLSPNPTTRITHTNTRASNPPRPKSHLNFLPQPQEPPHPSTPDHSGTLTPQTKTPHHSSAKQRKKPTHSSQEPTHTYPLTAVLACPLAHLSHEPKKISFAPRKRHQRVPQKPGIQRHTKQPTVKHAGFTGWGFACRRPRIAMCFR